MKRITGIGVFRLLVVVLVSAATTTTCRAVDTHFADDGRTLNGVGAWVSQSFTLSRPTTFVLMFVSDFQAQCAVCASDQHRAFTSNQTFLGFGLFDRTFGTQSFTLNPGSYFVGMRSMSAGANNCRYELDF